jgi:hypothetical protein
MNIVINEPLIKRNGTIAKYSMFGGLAVLGLGMYVSFAMPGQATLSFLALIGGFILSQIGISYSNKFGRSPRPDEQLNTGLKGLDTRHTLYHYTTPVPHLLVGPSGVWILIPMHQGGTISYSKDRWRQRGGNLYMKIFAQESLGRPDVEMQAQFSALNKYLAAKLPDDQIPAIQVALVFTSPKAQIDIPEDVEPPALTVSIKDLKDALRKSSKTRGMPAEKFRPLQELLEESATGEAGGTNWLTRLFKR